MLSQLQEKFRGLVRDEWHQEMSDWGDRVELLREYAEGHHRAKLTNQMRQMLRLNSETDQFNINYCRAVISAMAERLTVRRVGAMVPDQTADEWADDLLRRNRFDGLQMDVHEAAIRDGDTFIMAEWVEGMGVRFAHEPAWDGETGVLVVYDRMRKNIIAGVKVWWEGDGRRANIYYADRVEKYLLGDGNVLSTYMEPAEWRVGRVPIVHFRNRGASYAPIRHGNYNTTGTMALGQSELQDVIPLQDALNRTLYSMVMTAELSAFQIRIARGFEAPTQFMPGTVVEIAPDGLTNEQVADMSTLEQASLVPFIDQAKFLIEQIASVSRTPLAQMMGADSQSGEALKQREIGLLGKIRRFQVKAGNSWEDLLTLAGQIEAAYGNRRPPETMWQTVWQNPEIREDAEDVQTALAVRDLVGDREALRLLGRVYGWDEGKVESIMQERASQAGELLAGLNLPGFAEFTAN